MTWRWWHGGVKMDNSRLRAVTRNVEQSLRKLAIIIRVSSHAQRDCNHSTVGNQGHRLAVAEKTLPLHILPRLSFGRRTDCASAKTTAAVTTWHDLYFPSTFRVTSAGIQYTGSTSSSPGYDNSERPARALRAVSLVSSFHAFLLLTSNSKHRVPHVCYIFWSISDSTSVGVL